MCSLAKTSRSRDKAHGSCGVLLLDVADNSGWRQWLRVRRGKANQAKLRLESLAAALEQALPGGWRVFSAVHGTAASIHKALEEAADAGARRLVVIPLHPQRSDAVSGRAMEALYAALRGPHTRLAVEVRASYGDDAAYIDLVARDLLNHVLASSAAPASHELVFIPAPGLEAAAAAADYRAQLEHTAVLVAARLGWDAERWRFSPQRIAEGPGRLLCEIGRLPLACDDLLIKTLVGLVRRGTHVTDVTDAGAEPLLRQSWRTLVERDVDDLVMLGISVPGALNGDGLRHCTKDQYRALKRPHMDVVQLLESLRQRDIAADCFIWSTCNRFEFYGWLPGHASRNAAIGVLQRELLGVSAQPLLNVLEGRQAWRHLLRTAAGLNSALAGDGEVVDQLEGAVRTAHHAGSAGDRSDVLVADAREAIAELRQCNSWGRYTHRYCWVALERLEREIAPLAAGQIVVLGGSTTSCSLLEGLRRRFGISRERISVIYRGQRNGRLAKRLHDAAGPVIRVEQYADAAVSYALASANLVFLATDQREPVLYGRDLANLRDLRTRPMLLIDFNTFASTQGIQGIPGTRLIEAEEIDRRVQEFNEHIVGDGAFQRAAAEADRWIRQRTGQPAKRLERQDTLQRRTRQISAGALA